MIVDGVLYETYSSPIVANPLEDETVDDQNRTVIIEMGLGRVESYGSTIIHASSEPRIGRSLYMSLFAFWPRASQMRHCMFPSSLHCIWIKQV